MHFVTWPASVCSTHRPECVQEAEVFYFQMQLELDLVQVESIDFATRHQEVQRRWQTMHNLILLLCISTTNSSLAVSELRQRVL